jgi:hypothetical protein
MNIHLSAARIAELCKPPAGSVKPQRENLDCKAMVSPAPKVKKNTDRKYSINKDIAHKISEWRKTNPNFTYREIADHFKVGLNTAYYSINPRKPNASQP